MGNRVARGAVQGVATALLLAVLVLLGVRFLPGLSRSGDAPQQHSTEVIQAVTSERQVILLRLGIQGISEARTNGKIFGVDVPGSDRTTFLQYNFRAALGLDGKDVTITKAGDKRYTLTLPPFSFLGHDEIAFKLITEKNGALSIITPEIDQVQMINNVLSADAQQGYLDQHRDALQEQARQFYEGIITAADPGATVTIEYRS